MQPSASAENYSGLTAMKFEKTDKTYLNTRFGERLFVFTANRRQNGQDI
jgi:hypothetical protein